MNYNKLNFSLFVENNLTSFRITRKEYPEVHDLPLLVVVTKGSPRLLNSKEDIISYLSTHNYLKKGISHSAWEQQSFAYLQEKACPIIQGYTTGVFKRFQQGLKVLPRGSLGIHFGMITDALVDTVKLSYHDRFRSDIKKSSREDYLEEVKAWNIRLAGGDFHGGKLPDKADFFMYACLESTWKFSKEIVFQVPAVWFWKEKMDKLADQAFES